MVGQNQAAGDDGMPPTTLSHEASPLPTETKAASPAAQVGFTLVLSPKRQQLGGLQTKPLAAFTSREDTLAYGRVLDIRPLLELRSRYRSAQSELAITEAALQVAQKNHDRLETLHRESIVATRELIQAESQLAADEARNLAAVRHIREVREDALQSFGETLFKLAVETESRLFQNLLNHAFVLVLVALPANQSLPGIKSAITLAPSGEQNKSRQARLLAPAPKTEESTQGETWFFETSADGLRTGMRLDAWIPHAGHALQGVLIPLSAVVWHEGQAWVYLKTSQDHFTRRVVKSYRERGEDWFVAEGFVPGQEAVVVGGQMLLSEEQRRIAPRGDDD